jgi:Holliday junction resolvasome RuvABC DNA-binding subunit
LLKQLFDFQVIDESVFKQGLQQLGYTTDDIDTIFPFLLNERVYTYTEKIAEEALNLYETGRITDSQLRDFLSTAHWQDLEITTAIQYADLKKLKVTLSSSEVLELYRHKLMTQTDAITYLENIGYNSTDANLLLQLEIAKEAPKPPRVRVLGGHTLTVAEILKAYKERINSLQETVSRLKEYGYSDEDISDLLALNPPK